MRIRFDAPADLFLHFEAGDELTIHTPTASLVSALANTRLDGSAVAHVVRGTDAEDEVADRPVTGEIAAPVRRHARAAAVSR